MLQRMRPWPITAGLRLPLDLPKGAAGSQVIKNLDNHSGHLGFLRHCDITGKLQRGQSFIATKSANLTAAAITGLKTDIRILIL